MKGTINLLTLVIEGPKNLLVCRARAKSDDRQLAARPFQQRLQPYLVSEFRQVYGESILVLDERVANAKPPDDPDAVWGLNGVEEDHEQIIEHLRLAHRRGIGRLQLQPRMHRILSRRLDILPADPRRVPFRIQTICGTTDLACEVARGKAVRVSARTFFCAALGLVAKIHQLITACDARILLRGHYERMHVNQPRKVIPAR